MRCPNCHENRNLADTIYQANGKTHRNVICLSCGQRSLRFHVKHLILQSGSWAFKFKNEVALINKNALTIGDEVTIYKIEGNYFIEVFGETVRVNGFRNPPAPLSLLK